MEVSIGVMAHNEAQNIERLLESLLSQKTDKVKIREIIIVSSGSTDRTDRIVKSISEKNKKIILLKEEKRRGKSSAINKFIRAAQCDILIMISADTVADKNAVENLCRPLNDKSIGIVGGRPIPKNPKKNYLNSIIKLQWLLHHEISLSNPKFGELIAFRRLFEKIGDTAVDEEHIAMIMKGKGFRGAYAPNAIAYNTGPLRLYDFIMQRRRIYCGHMELKKKRNYKPKTMNNFYVLKLILKRINYRNFVAYVCGVFLEGCARLLGVLDYYTNKKYYKWDVVRRAKI